MRFRSVPPSANRACIILTRRHEYGILRVEISVVPPRLLDPATDGRVSKGDRSAVRYAGTCHENLSRRPLGRLGRTRAVARWDGNVALQRWGCGRCRPRDGGRGYRFTARRSLRFFGYRDYYSRDERELSRSSSGTFSPRFFVVDTPALDYNSFRLHLLNHLPLKAHGGIEMYLRGAKTSSGKSIRLVKRLPSVHAIDSVEANESYAF